MATPPTLRERLTHLVAAADDNVWAGTHPVTVGPVDLAVLGSIRPLRRWGGREAAETAERTLEQMPQGYVDVWVHQRAAQRVEVGVLREASRRDVDLQAFASSRLDHPASWDHAQLDPPKPGEEPDYPEDEARGVALAALKHEGLPAVLLGKHLLFCRYTCEATLHQPVWLALFEAHGVRHLLIVNADSDRLLEPVDY